jgi:hypothetical protein
MRSANGGAICPEQRSTAGAALALDGPDARKKGARCRAPFGFIHLGSWRHTGRTVEIDLRKEIIDVVFGHVVAGATVVESDPNEIIHGAAIESGLAQGRDVETIGVATADDAVAALNNIGRAAMHPRNTRDISASALD